MRRNSAIVVMGVLTLLGGGLFAGATAAAPKGDACAKRGDALGVSRVVEIDTANGPRFGKTPTGDYDILADGEIVLTFDDGPLRPYTPAVLNALEAHCTKATFFMVGRMAVSDPAMVKEVAKRGHTIAGHTWSHAKLQTVPLEKAKDEIELGFSAIASALGKPIAPFFRFPYLRTSKPALGYLKSRGIASFAINIDSRDFETRNPNTMQQTVLAQLTKARKGILLFHDIQPSTAKGLNGLLAELKARGFKVVHFVPKSTVKTLPDYDTIAHREIARRRVATADQPVTSPPRGISSAKAGQEVLPWAKPASQGAKNSATKNGHNAKGDQ